MTVEIQQLICCHGALLGFLCGQQECTIGPNSLPGCSSSKLSSLLPALPSSPASSYSSRPL